MAADRRTPTSGPKSGEDYAIEVDEEIVSLNNRSIIYLTSVAGTDTITAAATPPLDGYVRSQTYALKPAATNTGAATINIDSRGAKSIKSGLGATLVGGELLIDSLCLITYDGTDFRLLGALDQRLRLAADGSRQETFFTGDTGTGF